MAPRLVFLWSTRRTLSTPFQRAIYQLDGIKHFTEPFALAYYFGPDRRSVQFLNNQEIANQFGRIPTNAEQLNVLTADYEGYHTTFIKEHALYAWPNIIPPDVLQTSMNTFLIRHPEKAIKSLYRQTLENFEDSAWSHIVPEELGFKEQFLMYTFVTKELKQDTLVIDADDLIKNPREVLERYCAFVGLTFDEVMLDWSNDGSKAEEKPWDFIASTWIKDLKQTTGFRKKEKVQDIGVEYPQFIYDAIENNIQYYEALQTHKIQINNPVPVK